MTSSSAAATAAAVPSALNNNIALVVKDQYFSTRHEAEAAYAQALFLFKRVAGHPKLVRYVAGEWGAQTPQHQQQSLSGAGASDASPQHHLSSSSHHPLINHSTGAPNFYVSILMPFYSEGDLYSVLKTQEEAIRNARRNGAAGSTDDGGEGGNGGINNNNSITTTTNSAAAAGAKVKPYALNPTRVSQLGLQLCSAVAHLHARRPYPIVHGDIKAQNVVFFNAMEQCMLIDLDVAFEYRRRTNDDGDEEEEDDDDDDEDDDDEDDEDRGKREGGRSGYDDDGDNADSYTANWAASARSPPSAPSSSARQPPPAAVFSFPAATGATATPSFASAATSASAFFGRGGGHSYGTSNAFSPPSSSTALSSSAGNTNVNSQQHISSGGGGSTAVVATTSSFPSAAVVSATDQSSAARKRPRDDADSLRRGGGGGDGGGNGGGITAEESDADVVFVPVTHLDDEPSANTHANKAELQKKISAAAAATGNAVAFASCSSSSSSSSSSASSSLVSSFVRIPTTVIVDPDAHPSAKAAASRAVCIADDVVDDKAVVVDCDGGASARTSHAITAIGDVAAAAATSVTTANDCDSDVESIAADPDEELFSLLAAAAFAPRPFTAEWAAPETLTSNGDDVSPRSDVWGLGMLLLCLLVGRDCTFMTPIRDKTSAPPPLETLSPSKTANSSSASASSSSSAGSGGSGGFAASWREAMRHGEDSSDRRHGNSNAPSPSSVSLLGGAASLFRTATRLVGKGLVESLLAAAGGGPNGRGGGSGGGCVGGAGGGAVSGRELLSNSVDEWSGDQQWHSNTVRWLIYKRLETTFCELFIADDDGDGGGEGSSAQQTWGSSSATNNKRPATHAAIVGNGNRKNRSYAAALLLSRIEEDPSCYEELRKEYFATFAPLGAIIVKCLSFEASRRPPAEEVRLALLETMSRSRMAMWEE